MISYRCAKNNSIFELDGEEFIACDDQAEIDYFWEKLTSGGGEESMCGWLKDKYGLSWQVVPKNIGELLSKPGATKAMLKMKKLVIAGLQNV